MERRWGGDKRGGEGKNAGGTRGRAGVRGAGRVRARVKGEGRGPRPPAMLGRAKPTAPADRRRGSTSYRERRTRGWTRWPPSAWRRRRRPAHARCAPGAGAQGRRVCRVCRVCGVCRVCRVCTRCQRLQLLRRALELGELLVLVRHQCTRLGDRHSVALQRIEVEHCAILAVGGDGELLTPQGLDRRSFSSAWERRGFEPGPPSGPAT